VPEVTISATDANAAEEGPDAGTLTITRSGTGLVTDGDLTVNYNVSGTASAGDYSETLSGSVVIPDGQASVGVTITPVDDSEVEGDETVVLTLGAGSGYTVGAADSDTVTIADNDVVGVVAEDDFESGDGSGGTGWSAPWSLSKDADVTTSGGAHGGSYHLQFIKDGVASRTVDLSGQTDLTLSFWWKANSLESGEVATIEVNDGTGWATIQTIQDGDDDNVYHYAEYDLSGFDMVSDFEIRISLSAHARDWVYIDDLLIQ